MPLIRANHSTVLKQIVAPHKTLIEKYPQSFMAIQKNQELAAVSVAGNWKGHRYIKLAAPLMGKLGGWVWPDHFDGLDILPEGTAPPGQAVHDSEKPVTSDSSEASSVKSIVATTTIKSKVIASNYLAPEEKTIVPKGTVLSCCDCKNDKEQHVWVKLSTGQEGYLYKPHWDLGDSLKSKGRLMDAQGRLPVKYSSQRDNWTKYHGPGWRQCCATSHSMAADYLLGGELSKASKAKGYKEPEDLYGEVLSKYGDTTNPQAHTPTFTAFKLDSYFTYTASIKDLLIVLDLGVPVPLGVAYKAGGHYVAAVGYNKEGVWIHDPFGIRIGLSDNYENSSGAFDFVSYDWLKLKWVDTGGPDCGWARFTTAVKGSPTEVPLGL